MSGPSVKVFGLEKATRKLQEVVTEIDKVGLRGLVKGTRLILRDSMSMAPKKTGNLSKSGFQVWKGGEFNADLSLTDRIQEPLPGEPATTLVDKKLFERIHWAAIAEAKSEVKASSVPCVIIGHSAYYSAKVHEAPPTVRYRNGVTKFLERAVDAGTNDLIKAMKEEGKRMERELGI